MDQYVFTEDGEYLIKAVESASDDAPKFIHKAWRKAKREQSNG